MESNTPVASTRATRSSTRKRTSNKNEEEDEVEDVDTVIYLQLIDNLIQHNMFC